MKTIFLIFTLLFTLLVAVLPLTAQDKKLPEQTVFFKVEEMPEFPGGQSALKDFISQSVNYPEDARKNGIQGRVYVQFVVSKDGSVKDATVIRGVDSSLDNEALRVVNTMPLWKPGKQRGEAVDVAFTVPIGFALSSDDTVFFIVDEMPEFPGGDKALREFVANSVRYPQQAQKDSIQGKVFVSFVVAKDGLVKDGKVVRGVHPFLDEEALRVVNALPLWTPGKQRDQAVNVQYTIPINFVLQ